mgnify:CR=1 FL=1
MADTPQAGGPPPGAATFSIEKIYVKDLSLESLKGHKVVLFFYPKADTPG